MDEDIKQAVAREMYRIRKRVSTRKLKQQRRKMKYAVKSQTQPQENIDNDHHDDITNDSQDYTMDSRFDVEEPMAVCHPVDIKQEPSLSIDVQPNYCNQENFTLANTNTNEFHEVNTRFSFRPIENEEELEMVSNNIRTDAQYLDQLVRITRVTFKSTDKLLSLLKLSFTFITATIYN